MESPADVPSEVPGPKPEPAKRKRGLGKPFTKGDDPRRRGISEPEGSLPAGDQTQLEAMRHVATRAKADDRTVQQAELRAWLKADRRAFMGHLAGLEQRAAGESKRVVELEARIAELEARPEAGDDMEADEGQRRAKEVARRWLEANGG